jgi:hypothetical protein
VVRRLKGPNSKFLTAAKIEMTKKQRYSSCYGSALARAALVPIGLGLASFLLPSFFSFV